jgi:hypothetical protein
MSSVSGRSGRSSGKGQGTRGGSLVFSSSSARAEVDHLRQTEVAHKSRIRSVSGMLFYARTGKRDLVITFTGE